ncbi:ATP-binding protein [Blautia coccoides]|uniref:AAA family ATPase n=1 Tax=Blautia producta TaxID=33035 RepID=UPI0028A31878|nr:ATP-binding protein [Blautia coccoides]MDT4375840.1 ATP-binding protein [Blautia coccoides]
MKAELMKRLFKAIFSEDIGSLKKIAHSIISEERKLGHSKLADSLENITVNEKPRFSTFGGKAPSNNYGLTSLPTSRANSPLASFISRENLKHHMVLPETVEMRLQSIEKEYAAKERLGKYNLVPKKKILLHGEPGCGKTLSAERLAWNLGLPLLKVRFDALLSSYFGESASNLRAVFDYCKQEPIVLLLDECDFIAKSRVSSQDVGEVPRIVNMLLTLLDEYDAPGLVIATTNLKVSLDTALFRRFDDVIELPMPGRDEIKHLLEMTLSAMPVSPDINYNELSIKLDGYSPANIVLIAQRAAKYSVLAGNKKVEKVHFDKSISESAKF